MEMVRTHLQPNVEQLLENGLKAYGKNEIDEAVRCWRAVLELSPGHPQAVDFLVAAGFDAPVQEPVANNVVALRRADTNSREGLRQRVEVLVRERRLEEALSELDRARPLFPDDASISRSIRVLRDRLVMDYSLQLGRLDHVPRVSASREVISAARPTLEEMSLLKLIDGIASFGDLIRSAPMGRLETTRALFRFLERKWLLVQQPSVEMAAASTANLTRQLVEQVKEVVEAAKSAESHEPTPTSSGVNTNEPDFETLFRDATQAYIRRDYNRAIELFTRCKELRPDHRATQHNLQRLQARQKT